MGTSKAIAYAYEEDNTTSFDLDLSSEGPHTTLPLRDLLSLFENEISEIVSYDSFEYENSKNDIHIFRGSPKLHKCNYKITGSRLDLGQITLTRKFPFMEEEMIIIERALGALSIHLNNAIDYQSKLEEEYINALRVDSQLSSMD